MHMQQLLVCSSFGNNHNYVFRAKKLIALVLELDKQVEVGRKKHTGLATFGISRHFCEMSPSFSGSSKSLL